MFGSQRRVCSQEDEVTKEQVQLPQAPPASVSPAAQEGTQPLQGVWDEKMKSVLTALDLILKTSQKQAKRSFSSYREDKLLMD